MPLLPPVLIRQSVTSNPAIALTQLHVALGSITLTVSQICTLYFPPGLHDAHEHRLESVGQAHRPVLKGRIVNNPNNITLVNVLRNRPPPKKKVKGRKQKNKFLIQLQGRQFPDHRPSQVSVAHSLELYNIFLFLFFLISSYFCYLSVIFKWTVCTDDFDYNYEENPE